MMEKVKLTLDAISVGTVITTLIGWLPPVAAFLSIVWLLIQIYDRIMYGPRRKY